jgi:hypothetical protein
MDELSDTKVMTNVYIDFRKVLQKPNYYSIDVSEVLVPKPN